MVARTWLVLSVALPWLLLAAGVLNLMRGDQTNALLWFILAVLWQHTVAR